MHGGGAGIPGPGEGADDPLAVEGGAEPLVADVARDDVGDRSVEQDLDELGVVAEARLELAPRRRGPEPRVRPFGVGAPQRPAEAAEEGLVGEVPVDVTGGDLGHAGGRPGRLVPEGEGGAVLERAPEVRVDGLHLRVEPTE